jgi:hypothetical protein
MHRLVGAARKRTHLGSAEQCCETSPAAGDDVVAANSRPAFAGSPTNETIDPDHWC